MDQAAVDEAAVDDGTEPISVNEPPLAIDDGEKPVATNARRVLINCLQTSFVKIYFVFIYQWSHMRCNLWAYSI